MIDLEALERTAKAARDVGEAWLTHDDLTGVYPEAMAFIVEASPTAVLSLLSADRAALLAKCERYRDALEAIEDHTETDMDTGETGLSEAAQIARAALTEAP